MGSLTGFLIVGAVLAVALAGVLWQLRAARREDARRDRAARENTVHDVGPDALRLLQDLDLHLNLYLVDHPDVAEGFARLRRAVRDEQNNKGDA